MTPKLKRRLMGAVGAAAVAAVACTYYVKTHPLIFNESFWGHAHCIAQVSMSFRVYADDHNGQFPFDTNGYGNALLCLSNEVNSYWACLTGPGYDGKVFAVAAQTGSRIPESECGRVYVQGLSITNNPEIALLFDKIPTPGGDHCHLLRRLSAPLTREVVMLDGGNRSIRETEWAAFAKQQIELLVEAGVTRQQAEKYYSEKPTR